MPGTATSIRIEDAPSSAASRNIASLKPQGAFEYTIEWRPNGVSGRSAPHAGGGNDAASRQGTASHRR
jgi:hypothetical protein